MGTDASFSRLANLPASAASASKVVQHPKTIFCIQLFSPYPLAGDRILAKIEFGNVEGCGRGAVLFTLASEELIVVASLRSQHWRISCWMPTSRSAARASMSFASVEPQNGSVSRARRNDERQKSNRGRLRPAFGFRNERERRQAARMRRMVGSDSRT